MRQKQGEPEKNPWFLSERSSSIRTTSVHAWSLLAWSLLEHSDNLAPRLIGANACFGLPLVRIWEDPRGLGGDRDPFSLTVFQPFSSTDRSIVRKAVWRRSLDLRRLLDPVEEQDMPVSFDPTITVTDVPVPGNEWEAILHTGLNIRLPLVTLRDSESVSSDVGSVGFEFLTQDEPQTKVSLEWPWDTHSEWQPAIEFVTRVRVFLESCLDWHDLLRGWAVETTLADRTFQDVCKRYGEPGRFYHTLDHIHSVLRTVESLGANARHLNAVKLAAWLHDVVYDSRGSDK